MPGAKAREARNLLIFLNDYFGFARHLVGWDLDGNLALDALFILRFRRLCGAHALPFALRPNPGVCLRSETGLNLCDL